GFVGHSYARPTTGLDADVAKLTFQQAESFYQHTYGPSGAVLTIVGRFEPQETMAMVRRNFGTLVGRTGAPVPDTPMRGAGREHRYVETISSGPSLALVGWRGGRDDDPSGPALEVLSAVLFDGQPSRRARALIG